MARLLPSKLSLRAINNFLTVLVALLAVYLIASPFAPELWWWAQHDSPARPIVFHPRPLPAPTEKTAKILGDTLVIPRLNLEDAIQGGDVSRMFLGPWHVPGTSTPDSGGNTVIIAHRFSYTKPEGIFYFLDKVRLHDPITVYWGHKIYNYRVVQIKVVPNTELSVQANTGEPILTLYTCTPLWNPIDRLVVIAKLVES